MLTEVYLAPSDLAFGFDECPRCWWLARVPDRDKQVSKPFQLPEIFKSIDASMKLALEGEDLGHGKLTAKCPRLTGYFESQGIRLKISGYMDMRGVSDGGFSIWDLKATRPTEERLAKYSGQLHTYDYCLDGRATALGLICFEPKPDLARTVERSLVMMGDLTVLPVEIQREAFKGRLEEICSVAAKPSPPPRGAGCPVCTHASKIMSLAGELRNDRAQLPASPPIGGHH